MPIEPRRSWFAPVGLASTVDEARSGRVSLQEIVTRACDRVEAVEGHIHALLPETDRRGRLLSEAAALTARYADIDHRPPLFGALLGVKDIFHVSGFETRAGTDLPPDALAGTEGPCIGRLRAAGALVLGKTVTTEFAFYEPGPTRNPHDLSRTPGGSSSGSAAAVAAGTCPLATGSQTIGSIIRPAAYCGIVGFKPTFGRIETDGVIPFSASADHIGLFAPGVADMALAAPVALRDWESPGPTGPPACGVPEGPYMEQAPDVTRDAFEAQVERIAAAGHAVRRVRVLADIVDVNARHRAMIAAEMARAHERWLGAFADRYRPRTLALIHEGRSVTPEALAAARAGRERLRRQLERAMRDAGIDVWLSPAAMGPADVGLDSTGQPTMNLPWTHAGLPTVTVPAGRSEEGLPLGLQVVGRWGTDERLLLQVARLEDVLEAS